jgi:hypothetical protein
MTCVGQNLIIRSMDCDLKQINTWGSNSTCLGDIRKLQSLYLPVCNVLSVLSINMDFTWSQFQFSSPNLLLWFLDFLASSGWPKLFHPHFPPVHYVAFDSVNLCNCAKWTFPARVSLLSWSYVLMDGEELDHTRYIWSQSSCSHQFHNVNWIAKKAHVENYSKK